jgi:hypothetical protein
MRVDSKEERLILLKTYLDTRRGVGHTLARVKGLNEMPNAIVLVSSPNEGRHIENMARQRLRTFTWDNHDLFKTLMGSDRPLVIDNGALSAILKDALDLLRQARQENYVLVDEIQSLRKERSMYVQRERPRRNLQSG